MTSTKARTPVVDVDLSIAPSGVKARTDLTKPATLAMAQRLIMGEALDSRVDDVESITQARLILRNRGVTVTAERIVDPETKKRYTLTKVVATKQSSTKATATATATSRTAIIRNRLLAGEHVSVQDVTELGGGKGMLSQILSQLRKKGYKVDTEREITADGKGKTLYFIKANGRPRKEQVSAKSLVRPERLPLHTNGHDPAPDLHGALGLLGFTVRGLMLDDDDNVQLVVRNGSQSYVAELKGSLGGI